MANRRTVVFALNSWTYGEVEEHVISLASHISNFRYCPAVICADTEKLLPLTRVLDQMRVPRAALEFRQRSPLSQWRSAREVAIICGYLRAALLHVHLVSYNGGRVPMLAGKLARIPVVVTHHLAPPYPLSAVARLSRQPFLRGVQRFIAVSEANRQHQIKWLGLPKERTLRIHNGVVPPEPAPDHGCLHASLCQELGLPSGSRLIGMVGRLVTQKGIPWLLSAAPKIVESVPDVHFLMIGDGPLKSQLQEQAKASGVADRIHWLGFRLKAQEMVAGLDVLAMPSEFEGLPIVLLEAMAAGVPVVAHAVDGIPEALTDGVEGFLVQRGDVPMLADRLSRILLEPELAAGMGCRARMRILREFTAEHTARETCAAYEQILCRR